MSTVEIFKTDIFEDNMWTFCMIVTLWRRGSMQTHFHEFRYDDEHLIAKTFFDEYMCYQDESNIFHIEFIKSGKIFALHHGEKNFLLKSAEVYPEEKEKILKFFKIKESFL